MRGASYVDGVIVSYSDRFCGSWNWDTEQECQLLKVLKTELGLEVLPTEIDTDRKVVQVAVPQLEKR